MRFLPEVVVKVVFGPWFSLPSASVVDSVESGAAVLEGSSVVLEGAFIELPGLGSGSDEEGKAGKYILAR